MKKKNKFLSILAVLLVIIIISAGLYYFINLSKNKTTITSNRNLFYTMDATFFDINGNPVDFTPQAIVNGQSGIHYLILNVRVDNTGTADLTNVRISNVSQTGPDLNTIYFNDFNLALQNPASILSLPKGQNSQWATGNSCTSDAQCATSEVCIGSTPTCKIPINNYLGDVAFRTIITADWSNAYGTPQTPLTNSVILVLSFQPENVRLRFEALPNSTINQFINTWISYDLNNDGALDKFGGASTINIGGVTCFASGQYYITTYSGLSIQTNVARDRIYVCKELGTIDNSLTFLTSDSDSSRAIITSAPTEPYTSRNCGGNSPCQEMYSTSAGPANITCTDNIQNQDETDIDCGGLICASCSLGLRCVVNTDCASNLCQTGICSNPSPPPGNQTGFVKFKTSIDTYDYVSGCGGATPNGWISYIMDAQCSQNLTGMGVRNIGRTTSGTCDSQYGIEKRLFQVPYSPTGNCKLNDWGNGQAYFYDAQIIDGIGIYAICETDADGNGLVRARFSTSERDAPFANTNSQSVTPSLEVACTA